MTAHDTRTALALRARLEDEIERLIALLDTLDGDPDFEDDDVDEPTLGWNASGHPGRMLSSLDGEFEDEGDGEPDEDGEPWLGATVEVDQRLSWPDGPDGRVIDGEAFLGSAGCEEAFGRYAPCADDAELG
ncbi:hypothetical protein [Afifella sp. YEN Y35]|uniref:hypothetical protein n=1 Tax=Afifella sp. YEN Y35 TaxID=3388337 RepID=UPI0039DF88F6